MGTNTYNKKTETSKKKLWIVSFAIVYKTRSVLKQKLRQLFGPTLFGHWSVMEIPFYCMLSSSATADDLNV